MSGQLRESELFAGLRGLDEGQGILLTPAPEVVELLEVMARELSTCRELLELLVDWAGARDRRDYGPHEHQPPSGDAPELREAAQEVVGAFTIAPGVTTGRQAKALEALRLAALAASQPPSGDAP